MGSEISYLFQGQSGDVRYTYDVGIHNIFMSRNQRKMNDFFNLSDFALNFSA